MNIYEYNAKKLIELRQKRGLSQRALGQLLGRDGIYIMSLEEGEEPVKILNVLQLCKVLKFDPSNFYEGYIKD